MLRNVLLLVLAFFGLNACLTYERSQYLLGPNGHVVKCSASAASNDLFFYVLVSESAKNSYEECIDEAHDAKYIAIFDEDVELSRKKRIKLYREAKGEDLVDPFEE